MNTSLPRQSVMLPTEAERRQIFYWLKQVSSWTAWNRILTYYKTWADAAEESVRLADNNGLLEKSSIPYDDYVFILKGLAHFEEGVNRLRQGDKRVFQYNAHGDFAMAKRAPHYWNNGIWGRGEFVINYENTPCWDEFEHALKKLNAALNECAADILERSNLDSPAPAFYGIWHKETMPRLPFPALVPEIPSVVDDILVRTGQIVPFSGIWEPVEVPHSKGLSLFRRPPPKGPFSCVGCMNYLHGGSPAPQATQRTAESQALHHVVVTWRLLWRDDRYEDGSVPEEEQGYRFLQPDPDVATQAFMPTSSSTRADPLVVATSGQTAPCSGRWLLQDDLQVSTEMKEGHPVPEHQGRSVKWVLSR